MAKQMITCASCGAHYDFLETETCPECGAINYPTEKAKSTQAKIRTIEHPQQEQLKRKLQNKQKKRGYTYEDRTQQQAPVYTGKKKNKPAPFTIAFRLFLVLILVNAVFSVIGIFTNLSSENSIETEWMVSETAEADRMEVNHYLGIMGDTYRLAGASVTVNSIEEIPVDQLSDDKVCLAVEITAENKSEDISPVSVTSRIYSNPNSFYSYDTDIFRPICAEEDDYGMYATLSTLFGKNPETFLTDDDLSSLSPNTSITGQVIFLIDRADLGQAVLYVELDGMASESQYKSNTYEYTLSEYLV